MLASASTLTSMLLAAPVLILTPPTAESEIVIPPLVWEAVEMTASSSGPLEIAEPGRYTVQFQSEDTVVVHADCNQVAGTYAARNGDLDITLTLAILERCSSDQHGKSFLELLDSATGFEMDPNGFLSVSGEKGKLRLRPSLADVVWEWQEFRGGDGSFNAPDHPEDYTLTFMPDGKFTILAGCVRTVGTFTVDGPSVDLLFDTAARAECRPGPLAERYLRDLTEVSSHVFRDGNLYLALRSDAGIMAFVARFAEPPRATPYATSSATDPA
jgi:heat shock protein HslJ